MFPSQPTLNRTDVLLRQAEVFGYDAVWAGVTSYLKDLLRRQLCTAAVTVAPLPMHVLNVVFGCAEKQVFGVDARRIVAMVAGEKRLGPDAVLQEIRDARRHHGSTADRHFAITLL